MNVFRMRLMGAKVQRGAIGSRTLKDAINEAFRDWAATVETHLLHVRHGGRTASLPDHGAGLPERHRQGDQGAAEETGRALPDLLVACVGGGSNAIGTFHPFIGTEGCAFLGAEAAGERPRDRASTRPALRGRGRRAPGLQVIPAPGRGRHGQRGAQHRRRTGLSRGGAGALLPEGY